MASKQSARAWLAAEYARVSEELRRSLAMPGYQWAWSRFRILRIAFFLLMIVGFSPLVPISVLQYYLAIESFWALTLVSLGLYLWKWKCPRCRKRFAGKTKKWLFLPQYCGNCGLQRYSAFPAVTTAKAVVAR